jgi:hypothetical protein
VPSVAGMPVDPIAVNQQNWDAVVPEHLLAYGVDDFVAEPGRITSVVRDDFVARAPHLPGRSPAGLDVVHLQCHIGLDTLSWARLGAFAWPRMTRDSGLLQCRAHRTT